MTASQHARAPSTASYDSEELWQIISPHMADFKGKLQRDVDMHNFTWFRTKGQAQLLFQPFDEEELARFLQLLPRDVPILPIGIGSNLLVRDGGIKGVVIRLNSKNFTALNMRDEHIIEAGAGVSDKKLALTACEHGLGGFHFYVGIPGSLGGALKMNAGANGVETAQRVLSARLMSRDGRIYSLNNSEIGYSYRHSNIAKDHIFLSACLQGYSEEPALIKEKIAQVQQHRETVQPIREKTGGSTFRNPQNHSAWRLIDEAGCRGLAIGDAQMSEMHCNFMINKGEASAFELELLGETVRQKVYEKHKILLEWEIDRVGQFAKNQEVARFIPQE